MKPLIYQGNLKIIPWHCGEAFDKKKRKKKHFFFFFFALEMVALGGVKTFNFKCSTAGFLADLRPHIQNALHDGSPL